MAERDTELIDKQEIELERVPAKELATRDEYVPHYKEQIDLNDEQIERLRKEIFDWFDAFKAERTEEELEAKWDEFEAQYKGEMDDAAGLEFNLDTGVTMVKCDAVERLSVKAFMESDPKFTVTPRPQTAKMDKWDVVVERQSDYLDYQLDEIIPLESPLRKVSHQAVTLGTGIMKVPYEYTRKKRTREESYSGKIEVDEQQQPRRRGLEAFLKQYPDAETPGNDGHQFFKDLVAGKDVTFKAEFFEVTYNDAKPAFVDVRDFFVSKDCEGYAGLCDTQLMIERQKYTWWNLKHAEKNGDLENVDQCRYEYSEDKNKEATVVQDYQLQKYEILECKYWFDMKGNDNVDDEERIVCWFDVASKAFLGAIRYPYDVVESDYVPFYVTDKEPGFYKTGLAESIQDNHLIQNAIINFMLVEAWMQLQTTPIVREGSSVSSQFVNKRWKPGVPITVPSSNMTLTQDIDFLDKPQRAVAAQLMNVILFLGKMVDDKTGVSSLATGKESPTDPTAPAAKTAMLLKQSGINISDYINCMLPSFNMVAEIVLQLTYQMSRGGRQFRQRQRASMVTGGDPFAEIGRDEMAAKTNIQSRAASFDFDKINEKRENLALYQLFRGDPMVMQDPEGMYTLARTLIQSWSPLWKNKVDTLLPNPQEFQKKQFAICLQALQLYMQTLAKKGQVTGAQQQPQFKEFAAMATQMMSQAVTPVKEEANA